MGTRWITGRIVAIGMVREPSVGLEHAADRRHSHSDDERDGCNSPPGQAKTSILPGGFCRIVDFIEEADSARRVPKPARIRRGPASIAALPAREPCASTEVAIRAIDDEAEFGGTKRMRWRPRRRRAGRLQTGIR